MCSDSQGEEADRQSRRSPSLYTYVYNVQYKANPPYAYVVKYLLRIHTICAHYIHVTIMTTYATLYIVIVIIYITEKPSSPFIQTERPCTACIPMHTHHTIFRFLF